MSKNYLLQKDGSFIIKDYNRTYPFSNFLPGIAGIWGIPLWVFYTNRGQGVASFGIGNKDHSIAEFFPANKAYSLTSSLGFRTFLKKDSQKFYEPFSNLNSASCQEMLIESDSFQVREVNKTLGLSFKAAYFTLPNMPVGSLVRVLTLKNISSRSAALEVIDGLPRIIPFGSVNSLLKDMSRTLEGWMHSKVENNLASFRLIVDPRDVSHTRYIEGANFSYSFYEDRGKKVFPYFIIDPTVLFGSGNSCRTPLKFLEKKFRVPVKQIYCGRTPCAFSHFKWKLAPGEEKRFYSLFGAYFKEDALAPLFAGMNSEFILKKKAENKKLIESIKNNAFCVSSSKEFNNYLGCTYLDNVLRGGYPYSVAEDHSSSASKNHTNSKGRRNSHTYYIFSRKHGDLERDYNYFQLLPSYFSEGEANNRDINQNRRMDLFFNPAIKQDNIIYFFNLIKIDGYNPLTVKGEKIYFNRLRAVNLLKDFRIQNPRLVNLMVKGFYMGEFFRLMEEEGLECKRRDELAEILISQGNREARASHGDGYWI
ncbi:MAG: hypothetical protein GF375_00650, partial [Candidatus Omnitrophica bacterium]|nr:hypothetical protein [Candidatus Omnitrophota bacterium]MBD3268668.1 hypothetical protein [Candidatus Omnitrophota bacterium]